MDPYQFPDSQEEAVISAMTTRLEARGDNATFNGYIDAYIAEFGDVESVLDIGCGTGVVTRRIHQQLGQSCEVHGVDISEKLLQTARENSSEEINWHHSDGNALPFGDKAFDVVVMHTLLTHVPNPVSILREAGRVLKEHGKLIIFDADYASTTFTYGDFMEGREIDHKLFKAIVHNLDVCRKMPEHIAQAGLRLEKHSGHVLSEAGVGDFWFSSVQGFEKLIPPLEILEDELADKWVKEMYRRQESKTFFASGNYYTYFVTK